MSNHMFRAFAGRKTSCMVITSEKAILKSRTVLTKISENLRNTHFQAAYSQKQYVLF